MTGRRPDRVIVDELEAVERRKLLHALRQGSGRTTGQIAFDVQQNGNAVASRLARMERAGLVGRVTARGSSPVRWIIRDDGRRELAGGRGEA